MVFYPIVCPILYVLVKTITFLAENLSNSYPMALKMAITAFDAYH